MNSGRGVAAMFTAVMLLAGIAAATLPRPSPRAGAPASRNMNAATIAGVLNVQSYGAVGNGVFDDTTFIQSALNQLEPGWTLLFPPGTYLATELRIPDVANITLAGTQGDGSNHGSVLKLPPTSATATGQAPRFLLAAEGFSTSQNWTGSPVFITDLAFEGPSDLVRNASAYPAAIGGVILMNWRSRVARCVFRGFAGKAGFVYAAANANGDPFFTTQVNSRFTENTFSDNLENGFMIFDPRRNVATDYFLSNNFAYRNGRYGFALDTTAGGLVEGNHLYSNGKGDVWCGIGSKALRLVHNYLEGPVGLIIETINPGTSVILANNFFEGSAAVTANDGNSTLVSTANVFSNPCASSGGAVGCMQLHGNRGHTLTCRSVADQFEDTSVAPYLVYGTVRVLTAPLVPDTSVISVAFDGV